MGNRNKEDKEKQQRDFRASLGLGPEYVFMGHFLIEDPFAPHPLPTEPPLMNYDPEELNGNLLLLRKLCHPIRKEILNYLDKHGPKTTKDLSQAFGTSNASMTYHLAELCRLRAVQFKAIGKANSYSLDREKVRELVDMIESLTQVGEFGL